MTNGHVIRSKMILSNATPDVTFLKLLPPGALPKAYENKIKAIDYTSPVTKINVALKELPNFLADPHANPSIPAPHHQCEIHLNCESMQVLDKAFQQGSRGLIPDRPMIEMTIPSSLDPTLAPPGCHVASLFTQYTVNHKNILILKQENIFLFQAFHLKDKPWDDELKESYAKQVIPKLKLFAFV